MKYKFITAVLLASISFSINAELSDAGKNATFHTKTCSRDGLTICLTGISNYLHNNKVYDVRFVYGPLTDAFPALSHLDATRGNVNHVAVPSPIAFDALEFMFEANREYYDYDSVTGRYASDVKTVFSSQNLVHRSETPGIYSRITWSGYSSLLMVSTLSWDKFTWFSDRNRPYRLLGDTGVLGADPEHVSISYNPVGLYMTSTTIDLSAP